MAMRPGAIYEATETCRRLLRECLSIKSLMEHAWAENRLADLNLWAAGLGAVSRFASLDERLSSKPYVAEIVANLLGMLELFLEQCKDFGMRERAKTEYMQH